MAAEKTENLGLLIFPDIKGIYQKEIRKAYDENAKLIDKAYKALLESIENLDIPSAIPIATTEEAGKVRPDGDTILIDADGIIRAAAKIAIANTENAGIVKPDGITITIDKDGKIRARDAYTKGEVDQILAQISDLLITDEDLKSLYDATNQLMGEEEDLSGLGDDIVKIDKMADEILK